MAAKMMALVSSFCCLLMAQILPTAGSAAAAAPPAATVAAGGMPALPFPFQFPFPFPGGSAAPGDGCMKAVQKAESCAADVLRSLASLGGGGGGPVGVGAGCCGVLQGVGDSCFRGVFPVSPFRALYGPLVKHACGLSLGLINGPGPRV
ncbi:hypothetical protein ACP70R_000706 [Stipagrostis hirtigluma subsp. patula]